MGPFPCYRSMVALSHAAASSHLYDILRLCHSATMLTQAGRHHGASCWRRCTAIKQFHPNFRCPDSEQWRQPAQFPSQEPGVSQHRQASVRARATCNGRRAWLFGSVPARCSAQFAEGEGRPSTCPTRQLPLVAVVLPPPGSKGHGSGTAQVAAVEHLGRRNAYLPNCSTVQKPLQQGCPPAAAAASSGPFHMGLFDIWGGQQVLGSGYVSGYVSWHHELLYLQLRGVCYGVGYVSGYVSRVCSLCALLKTWAPEKNRQTHMVKGVLLHSSLKHMPARFMPQHVCFAVEVPRHALGWPAESGQREPHSE